MKLKPTPMPQRLPHEHGPFDIIGDVHGCYEELLALLTALGYPDALIRQAVEAPRGPLPAPDHPRRPIFVGDLVDRGPRIVEVLRLVMALVRNRLARAVIGNRDAELARHLRGEQPKATPGMQTSLGQLHRQPQGFRTEVGRFIESLPDHLVLDDGRLIVAHAGLPESMHGRDSPETRAFAIYGPEKGKDEFGFPRQLNWAVDYQGAALVVYGHSPVVEPLWIGRTVNIDTGCVYGGRLTAFRYPELDWISVPSRQTNRPPSSPSSGPAP